MKCCRKCAAVLTPTEFFQHQLHFHIPQSSRSYPCSHCSFMGSQFPLAVAHALLEGHELAFVKPSLPALEDMMPSSRQLGTETVKKNGRQFAVADSTFGQEPLDREVGFNKASDAKTSPLGYTETAQCLRFQSQTAPEDANSNQTPSILEDSLQCLQCRGYIKCLSPKNRTSALNHVRKCCNIFPFSCSFCAYKSAQTIKVVRHIEKRCSGAVLVHLDRESNDVATKEGLQKCFPSLSR